MLRHIERFPTVDQFVQWYFKWEPPDPNEAQLSEYEKARRFAASLGVVMEPEGAAVAKGAVS